MVGTFKRTVVLVEPADQVHGSDAHALAVECPCGALVRQAKLATHVRMVKHDPIDDSELRMLQTATTGR